MLLLVISAETLPVAVVSQLKSNLTVSLYYVDIGQRGCDLSMGRLDIHLCCISTTVLHLNIFAPRCRHKCQKSSICCSLTILYNAVQYQFALEN